MFKRLLPMVAFGLLALIGANEASAQTSTTGAIQGVVTDEATGQPMLLVTVVATSPALQQGANEFTQADGSYMLTNLPPGRYTVLYIYGDAKTRRENVDVFVGKTIVVNAKINTAATGTVITIKEKAPTIDVNNTKQSTTITPDYTKNVPTRGRTYEGVLGAAPGAQGDAYGVSFGGSTSVENNYIVDGINTTGLSFGTVGSPLLNNFIQEVEIITGGYNAEFGRSTGGVVNVVTKTGSNEFHGSVWANVTPFEAAREGTFTAGSALRSKVALDTEMDFGFELGGPIIKDKVWFYVGFAPVINSVNVTRIASMNVDREFNNWDYEAMPDPDADPTTVRDIGCEARAGVNCESDGRPDIDPSTGFAKFEEIDRKTFTDTSTQFQVTSKVNFAVAPEHQGQVSFTGNFAGRNAILSVNGTPTATQEDLTSTTTDLAVKWTSKFLNNKLQVDAVAGWHHDDVFGESVNERLPGSGELTRTTPRTRYVRYYSSQTSYNLGTLGRNRDTNESQAILDFCTDDFTDPTNPDPFPSIQNCPTSTYLMNSLGFVDDTAENRYSGKVTATYRLKAAGHHQFKVGADFEDNFLDDNRILTGGQLNDAWEDYEVSQYVKIANDITNWTRPDGGMYDVCRIDVNGNGASDTAVPCTYYDGSYASQENDPENPILAVHGETFNWSGFVQDSWSILPNLTLNLGFRYEQQRLKYGENVQDVIDRTSGEPIGENALNLTNLYSPRLGLIYDWTKEGRSKVYANYGRFYESIPMDINTRAFGGEILYEAWWDYSQCPGPVGEEDPLVPALPENCPDQPARVGTIDDPVEGDTTQGLPYYDHILGAGSPEFGVPFGVVLVVPGVQPQYIDEYGLGVEYEVLEDLRVGLAGQYRSLGEAIEDVSVDGATTYFLANPGNFPVEEEEKMERQIMDLPADSAERAFLQNRLDAFRRIRDFDRPRRDYMSLQLTAVKRFSRAFMLQGSYTYSRLEGNYPGLFSPDTGQLDPNITSQYDLIELLANRDGRLPHDRPHSFKLDGYYTFDLQEAGRVTTGARLRAQSGTPIDALGTHNVYGQGEAFVLPRGAGGRTAFVTQADLHVAYGRRIGSQMEIEVFFELFNVFNTQTEVSQDERYTTARVNPIVGGGVEDLPYLKTQAVVGGALAENAPGRAAPLATRNVNYGNTSGRLAPLTGRFGLRLSF